MPERISGSRLTTIFCGNANTPLVGSSIRRKAIIFYPVGAQYYAVGTEPQTSADTGILVASTTPPIEFQLDRHGDVVQKAWFGFGKAAITVVFLEVFM